MHIICPNRVSRRDWIIAVSFGICFRSPGFVTLLARFWGNTIGKSIHPLWENHQETFTKDVENHY